MEDRSAAARLRGLWRDAQAQLAADDAATQAQLASQAPGHIDGRAVTALVACAVNLTLIRYFGMTGEWRWMEPVAGWLGGEPWQVGLRVFFRYAPEAELHRLLYWVAATVLFYFVVPAAIVRFGFKARLSDFGLTRRGFVRHLPIYGALYVAVLPLVLFAARQPAFLKAYPFYGRGHLDLPGLLTWELAYGLQFFALEFFFRGFLLHATRARLGWYSVLVMTVPYCMIHFGKPAPETLGAIVAGVVLGTLALWTRSIWPGVLVHISVAWTMDALAMLGRL